MAQRQDSYLEHFGLARRPFSLQPDPDFLFWSATLRGALQAMRRGLASQAPVTLITGPTGTGKTSLLHHFLDGLDAGTTVAAAAGARPGVADVLPWLLPALGETVPVGTTDAVLSGVLQARLAAEAASGRSLLLVIDDAQLLAAEALPHLRMLSGLRAGPRAPLLLMLVGEPRLRAGLFAAEEPGLAQRVGASFEITAMESDRVPAYIAHRLLQAGGTPEVFSLQAAEQVRDIAGGVPRLINQLCDLALAEAHAAGETQVRQATVLRVLAAGTFFAGGPRG